MKKIFLILSFAVSFFLSYGQTIVPRSNGSLTVQDSNWFGGNSFRVPVFNDTAQANTRRPSLDSSGKIIWTRSSNWFWGRQTSPTRKWVPFENSSNQLNTSCGSPNGTHLVTWDSLLTFDVTGGPYVLCCDGIPRATNFTTVTLDSNGSDYQRIDLIILDSNGVNFVKGTPALNVNTPQTDSCQIILSYVLINAHDSVPALITPTNPLTIYDENIVGTFSEWLNDSTNGVTLDTADLSNPVHLTHDINVSLFSNNGYFVFTSPQTIDLNNYSAFKFYVDRASNTPLKFIFTWYLDGVQQTFPATETIFVASGYQIHVIPISSFRVLGTTSVNKLRITIQGTTAPMQIDWIQLQGGSLIVNSGGQGTVTSIAVDSIPLVAQASVTNPNSNAHVFFTKDVFPPYRLLGNDQNTPTQYNWVQVNLATDMVTGLLPFANIAHICDGCYLGGSGGSNQAIPFVNDTTFVHNWIYRSPDPNSPNDTLSNGFYKRDSSTLIFDTYFGLNSHFADWTQGLGDVFKMQGTGTNNAFITVDSARFEEGYSGTSIAAANNLTLSNDANTFTISGATQINAITTSNWQAGSVIRLIFTGAPTVKNNTAGGAGTSPLLLAGGVDYTVAANDVLTLVLDQTKADWHESSRKTANTVTSQTLQQTFNTEVGGSVLTKTDTIQANANTLTVLGNGSGKSFVVTNTSSGDAITGTSSSGHGVLGSSTSGAGVSGISTNSYGGVFQSTTQIGLLANGPIGAQISSFNSSTNTVVAIANFYRSVSGGSGANGVGGSLGLYMEADDGTAYLSNELISKWTTAANATRTSQFIITGVNSATTQNLETLDGSGQLTLNQYTTSNFNGGSANDSVLVVTSAGVVKKRDAASFGGAGNTIYTGDGSLAGDRTVDLAGHELVFSDGGKNAAIIALSGSGISSFNATGSGNVANIRTASSPSDAQAILETFFNDGDTEASITATAQSGSSSIAYTADTHTFDNSGHTSKVLIDMADDASGSVLQITGNSRLYGNFEQHGTDITDLRAATSSFVETVQSGSSNFGYFLFQSSGTTQQWGVGLYGNTSYRVHNTTASTDPFLIDASDNVTMSSLAGTGSRAVIASAAGVLSAPVSDISVKENIHDLDWGLDKIMQLRPVSFYFKDGWKDYGQGQQIGFIAQDIAAVLPNSVFVTPSTGKMGYNETDIIPLLVRAIQQQQAEIDALKRNR